MKPQTPSIAKLTRPRVPNVLARHRLFRWIDEARANHRVYWVWGPPGIGKTTLVASYLKARKIRHLWYQVDAGDADPGTVFHYLALGSQSMGGRSGGPLPSFTPEALPGLDIFARTFFEQLYSRLKTPAVLVFDNYHNVASSSSFHTLMEMAFGELPAGMEAIIISREPPPEHLARLQVLQALVQLHEAELQFTLQETQDLLPLLQQSRQASLSTQEVEAIHARMQGWVAGLVLTMQGDPKQESRLISQNSPQKMAQMLFEFLASEVFRKLEPEVQDFLVNTALLQPFTPAMAQALTGLREATAMLDQLYRRRYFIERRQQGEETVYQYHPLFREFLEVQGRRCMPGKRWQSLMQQAGKLLELSGNYEEACERYAAAGKVDEQIHLILEQAPKYLAQGRGQTLERWIARVPAEERTRNPWLLYWSGCCAFGVRVAEAVGHFEQAFYGFQQEHNYEGMGLAWAGWIEAIVIRWMEGKHFDHILTLYEEHFPKEYEFQDVQIKNRVIFSQFQAHLWRKPEYQKLQALEHQAVAVIDQERNPNNLANHCYLLFTYYLWMGKQRNFLDLIAQVQELTPEESVTPYFRGMLALMKSHMYWREGDAENVLCEAKKLNEIIKESGIIGGILTQNRSLKVYAHILRKEYTLAEKVLRQNDALLTHAPSIIRGYHHHQTGWVAWLQGNLFRAKEEVELALTSAYETGAILPIGLNHICASFIHQELGLMKSSAEHIIQGHLIGNQTRSAVILFLVYTAKAWQAFLEGKEPEGREALGQALHIGREKQFVETSWFHPRRMAQLCVKALEAGIETEYVRYLIQRRELMPEPPPLHLPDWPWPIRITTLGSFAIEIQGEPIAFARKTQKRTLALLKALVAGRRHEEQVDNLLDLLWPEAEGDYASNAFTTALHRLRKLLRNDQAVIVQESKVFLNPQLVWVDAWGFEAQLAKAHRYADEQHSHQELAWLERAVNLYQGLFLPAEEAEPWTMTMRDRLGRNYLIALEKLTQGWVQHQKINQAVQAWERALERAPQDERVYQHLMKILLQVGRWKKAQEVNLRCRTMLNHTYARAPAAGTPAIRAPERRQKKG